MLHGVTWLQVETTPICDFLKSSFLKPTAWSMARLGARSAPSTTMAEKERSPAGGRLAARWAALTTALFIIKGSECRPQSSTWQGCGSAGSRGISAACLPRNASNSVVSQLPDQMAAMRQRQRQQAAARPMFHAQQGFLAEFSVAERNGPAQSDKPQAHAEGDAGDAGAFALAVWLDPFARDEIRRQNDPKQQDPRIAHNAGEAGHERGARAQPLFQARFEAGGDDADPRRRGNRLGQEKFDGQVKHEHEAEQLHCGFDIALAEERGKTRERHRAIKDLHRGRP